MNEKNVKPRWVDEEIIWEPFDETKLKNEEKKKEKSEDDE